MPTLSRRVSPLVASTFAAHLLAQTPSPWRDLMVPGGVNPQAVTARGKLVIYHEATTVHVFSAVTNEWASYTPLAPVQYWYGNDVLMVVENNGNQATAFSAYRGTFETVGVSSFVGSSASDSIACVTDGTSLRLFSAFTGRWDLRPVPSGWAHTFGNRVAVMLSVWPASLQASAFDPFTGLWHDLPPQSQFASARAGLASVLLSTTQEHFGFSPLRPGWVQGPNHTTPPFTYASLSDEGDLIADAGMTYSGLTGTFSIAPTSPLSVYGNLAICGTAMAPFVLGAASNTWVPLPPVAPTSMSIASGFVFRSHSGITELFNPLLDTITTAPGAPGPMARNVATAGIGTSPHVFSALTDQWYPAPANTSSTSVADDSVLCSTPAGQVVGFAAPSGAMVPLAGSGFSPLGTGVVANATTIAAFDALGNRWLSMPRPPGAMQAGGSRTMFVGTVPGEAFAFSVRGRRLASTPIAGAGERGLATDVAFVRTATHIHAFSGLAESVTWQGDPIDPYGAGRGTTVRLQARVPTNHLVVLGFGPALASPVALPFGELWLDPAQAVTLFMVPPAGETRAILPIAIPNAPALRASMWTQQTVTLAPGGAIWLGAPSTLLVQ